jgi:hypothetical protein
VARISIVCLPSSIFQNRLHLIFGGEVPALGRLGRLGQVGAGLRVRQDRERLLQLVPFGD